MALIQQAYECGACGHRWRQFRNDKDPLERFCAWCHKPRAMAVPTDESAMPVDVRPGLDGLCWSDDWRRKPSAVSSTVTRPVAPKQPAQQPLPGTPPAGDADGEVKGA